MLDYNKNFRVLALSATPGDGIKVCFSLTGFTQKLKIKPLKAFGLCIFPTSLLEYILYFISPVLFLLYVYLVVSLSILVT